MEQELAGEADDSEAEGEEEAADVVAESDEGEAAAETGEEETPAAPPAAQQSVGVSTQMLQSDGDEDSHYLGPLVAGLQPEMLPHLLEGALGSEAACPLIEALRDHLGLWS